MNDTLDKNMEPEIINRPVGTRLKPKVKAQFFEFPQRAWSEKKCRRLSCNL